MARLNEPPIAPAPSAETIDAVKRRFLRQNRELAKTNSQQSIRIRTLENDASRLLAENLSLREQVLQLQNALEAQSNRPSFEHIDSVKDRLEAKIQELGVLVAELGQLKKNNDGLPRCKSQTAATRRSPDERQWRSGLCLQEVENSMMPTILEDKHYPRLTMNADELAEIMAGAHSQSPDLGPPPVSRFDDEGAIAFNPTPPPEEESEEPVEEPEPALPITLEMRRKRRESGPKANARRVSLFESPPEESEELQTKTLRAGTKRKFSVQEDDDKTRSSAETFRFSRRNTPALSEKGMVPTDARPKSPERPVLGSKPVNTDPIMSPKKQRSSTTDKPDKKPLVKNARSRLTITRSLQPVVPPLGIPDPVPTADIILDSLPPKTPAADDIFSPPSTEPSTSRPESKDTPPPGDLGLDDQGGLGGRPSRRARAQVSYKEPSLNTKMRRPGKELVDAVLPEHNRRMSVESQAPLSTSGKVTIKLEPDDTSWKPKGTGTVVARGGDEDGELGSPLRQKLDRKEGMQDPKVDPPKLNSAAASQAISAMIEETSTTKRKIGTSTSAISELTASKLQPVNKDTKVPAVKREPTDDLAIFDFTASSPATDSSGSSHVRPEPSKGSRSGRRHSSVAELAPKSNGGVPGVHKRTGSGGMKSVGAASSGKSTATVQTLTKDRERRTVGWTTNSSSLEQRAKLENDGVGVGVSRAERAASRRKSMML